MKYIIWGAGNRGKWTLKFLGEENVNAFIDSNKEKIGKSIYGKMIISPEQAIKESDNSFIVITPLNGSNEIERWLKNNNFTCYLKLDDCPMSIPCDEQEEFSFRLQYKNNICYGLLGVNLFSLWLCDELKKHNIPVKVSCQEGLSKDVLTLLKREYQIVQKSVLISTSEKIIVMEGFDYPTSDTHYIAVDDFIIQSMSDIRSELLRYKNIHVGKRCFIVATGPSLTVEDLKTLHEHREICFSMNRIFNIFSKTEWRPDYYVVGDKEMIEDLSDEIASLDLNNKFISTIPHSYWKNPKSKGSMPYKILMRGFNDRKPLFSTRAEYGLYQGTTVTYLCIQLAVYMGFSEIYLLGVDFSYTNNLYDPQNHFAGCDNTGRKVRLNPICPERTLLAYESSAEYCKNHYIKIFNATRGGKLEVFERKCFDSLFLK